MDLRHLRYFAAVAEAGHMTRAAAALGIQQPPLSQQIKALEAELGLQLLRRHPKGVSLTAGGRVLLAEAKRLLAEVEALRQRMARVARGEEGRLAVGFTSSAAAHAFTPQALRECRRRHPGIELDLSEDHAAALTEAVAAGRLHCGFLRVPVVRPPGLRFATLLEEPVLVALPADHPLAARPEQPLRLASLAGERLVLVRRPGAPGLYANLLALCHKQGVAVTVAAEVERMMSNLNLVAAGVGVSVVPASMRGTHGGAIVYRPLAGASALRAPLSLVWRAGEEAGGEGEAVASFIALVMALAQAGQAPAAARTAARRTKAAAA
ncbi:LysR family transcriptional regulator [uncultured Aquincola sp.]|uniref:LysR family transcriptional regulator n=1 Tax=uncultured Aquincola sp. TaxID=886556 RepID=UPI0032B2BDF1